MRVLREVVHLLSEVFAITANDYQGVLLVLQSLYDFVGEPQQLIGCQNFAALVVRVDPAQRKLDNNVDEC